LPDFSCTSLTLSESETNLELHHYYYQNHKVVGDGGGRGWLGMVDTRYGVSQPVASGRGVRVYT